MSNVYDYFQSLSTRDGTTINESFICCIKCFQHRINKIFSRKNVKELKSHLLEFHAIVADVEKGSSTQESAPRKEMNGDKSDDGQETKLKRKVVTRPSILNYYELGSNAERFCKLCKADNTETKYSSTTSATNLRLHLRNKHGYMDSVGNVTKGDKTTSSVWKYFCKPKRDGKVQDNDHVYCGKCLEKKKIFRYAIKTSTTMLKLHLHNEHSIDVSDDEEQNRPNVSQINLASIDSTEEKRQRAKRCTETSAIRKYFKQDEDYVLCIICEKEKTSRKFSQNTSSYTLKRHLIVRHKIDPLLANDEQNILQNDTIPSKVIARARETLVRKPPRPKNYFIQIETDDFDVYCCFCLVERQKRGFKASTSETNLKLHLVKVHKFDKFLKEPLKLITIRSPRDTMSVSQETADLARSLIETKGLPPRRYFLHIPKEPVGLIFCAFCTLKGIRQKYSVTTSPTNLLRHLRLYHNFDPKKAEEENLNEDECMDTTNDVLSEEELEVNEEEEEDLLPNHPEPVQEVLFQAHTSTKERNTKYCRSCGSYSVSFFSKFSCPFQLDNDENGTSHKNITLGDIYTEITEVQIYADDGMSQGICYQCEANLKTGYHFKKQATKTEENMIQKFSIDQPIEVPTVSMKYEIDDESEPETTKERIKRKKKNVDYFEEY